MSEQYEDDELEFETGDNLVKDLRKQAAVAKKRAAELEQELAALKNASRERTLADVLSAKGVNSKVAKFIPSDVDSEESINAWLEENADAFGVNITPVAQEEIPTPAPTVNPAVVAEAKRLQTLGQSAATPEALQNYKSEIAAAKTPKEIQEAWAKAKQQLL